jgi:hypothetical protein
VGSQLNESLRMAAVVYRSRTWAVSRAHRGGWRKSSGKIGQLAHPSLYCSLTPNGITAAAGCAPQEIDPGIVLLRARQLGIRQTSGIRQQRIRLADHSREMLRFQNSQVDRKPWSRHLNRITFEASRFPPRPGHSRTLSCLPHLASAAAGCATLRAFRRVRVHRSNSVQFPASRACDSSSHSAIKDVSSVRRASSC